MCWGILQRNNSHGFNIHSLSIVEECYVATLSKPVIYITIDNCLVARYLNFLCLLFYSLYLCYEPRVEMIFAPRGIVSVVA